MSAESIEKHLKTLSDCGIQRQKESERFDFPLTDYWIASSHNTYLTEDQIFGPASVCGYILFLNQFRGGCLEIDPGYVIQRKLDSGVTVSDVSVTHVLTPAGHIWLSDLLAAIRKWLDENQERAIGPIILSFDNKTITLPQHHAVIWQLFDRYINLSESGAYCHIARDGCRWYFNPADVSLQNVAQLSPQALKGKFIIKWEECRSLNEKGDRCDDKHSSKALLARELTTGSPQANVAVSGERFVHMPKSKSCKLYSDSCNVAASDPALFWNVSSSEHAFPYGKVSKTVVLNTMNNFVRLYPNPLKPANLKSSNYSQVGAWLNGVQMAAINTQKQDRYWQVNYEMFRDTPYRLKPQWMRSRQALEARFAQGSVPRLRNLVLQFQRPLPPAEAAQFHFFHPSGESSKAISINSTDGKLVVPFCDPTLAILYVERGEFVGAIDVPNDECAVGVATLHLYKWSRPPIHGIKYMGPNCNYLKLAEESFSMYYMWI